MRPAVWLLAPKFVALTSAPRSIFTEVIRRWVESLDHVSPPESTRKLKLHSSKVTIVDCRSQDLDIGALQVDARPDMHACGVLRQGERS